MYDDSEIFDIDDTIVFSKNKIILQKNNSQKNETDIQKHLKELDGNWELDLSNIDKEIIENSDWIGKNEFLINLVYKDLQIKALYSDVLSKLSLFNLCAFLESSSKSNYKYNNDDWNIYEEYKLYGMKKPTINEWSSFHILELHKLYSTYNSHFKLGKIEDFIKFCFENSLTLRLPEY